MTIFQTERLVIRPWRDEDRPALERMVRDAEMMRYVTQGWIWKDYWGQGFATEAARAFVDYARDVMGLTTLVAVIDPPNAASKAVAEKLGLRFECIKSARETISRCEDLPIAFYRIRF